MNKNQLKILKIFFVSILFGQIFCLLFFYSSPLAAAVSFKPQVEIPGSDFQENEAVSVTGNTLAQYIRAIYQYGTAVVGIIAAIILLFSGVMWLTAGGNAGRVQEAQAWIKGALTGLILALLSYTILLTINPDLVNLKTLNIEPIKSLESGTGSGGPYWQSSSLISPAGIALLSKAIQEGKLGAGAVVGDPESKYRTIIEENEDNRYIPWEYDGQIAQGAYKDTVTNQLFVFTTFAEKLEVENYIIR